MYLRYEEKFAELDLILECALDGAHDGARAPPRCERSRMLGSMAHTVATR